MIDIKFVSGIERAAKFPKFLADCGLTSRFAVIQDTDLADSPDMYFDESLWMSIVDFVRQFNPDGEVVVLKEVVSRLKDIDGVSTGVVDHIKKWDGSNLKEREPPGMIIMKLGGCIDLCVITEYWNRVGGPYPYSDSYTYSIFSKINLSGRVIEFLSKSSAASRWNISAHIVKNLTQKPTHGRVS